MKILAVRLAEVGRFTKPVALEGLSNGLNILVDDNEAGKSTVLAALKIAFEQSHKTSHRDVKALKPYVGGAPRVEVDFTFDGDTWRLRKQFLAQSAAELRNLTTGKITRGADAEAQLADILGERDGRASMGLLWANQKEALVPAALDDEQTPGLKRAISAQIDATVGGSEARKVRLLVRAELENFVTAQRAQPRGDYDAARKQKRQLEDDLNAARLRCDAARTRLDLLVNLTERESDLADANRRAERDDAITKAQVAVAAAREAQQKQRLAANAVAAAESHLALAQSKRDALVRDIAQVDALVSATALDQDEARAHASALADAEAAALEARAVRDAAREELLNSERELRAAHAVERRREARKRHAEMGELLAQIDATVSAGLERRAQLESVRVTAERLQALKREEASAQRIEDRLAAAAPKLTIGYEPGASGRIFHAGVAMPDGTHVVDRPLILTIPGIGTIEIAPGASDDRAAEEAQLRHHRDDMARMLEDCGVANTIEAEAQLAERRRIEADVADARTRLAALTPPMGLNKLRQEFADLSARIEGAQEEDAAPVIDIEARIEQQRQAVNEATTVDERAHKQVASAREASARQSAASAQRLDRLTELEHSLPGAARRSAVVENYEASLAEGRAALHAAVRDHAAWSELAPEPALLAKLDAEAQRLVEARQDAERQLQNTRHEIARVQGELQADRNDDVEVRVSELEGKLQAATKRVERLDEEVAVLQLLDRELQAEAMRSQDQYLRPVTDRLMPLVSTMFPGSDIGLAENFAPSSLRRGQEREAIAALSEGTQEQLAVMVRLAFGRLMADSGNAMPVILDDALVYSDDKRIVSMFEALRVAAQHHQIIVLTCRSRTFEALAGHRLRLAPWHEDRAEFSKMVAAS